MSLCSADLRLRLINALAPCHPLDWSVCLELAVSYHNCSEVKAWLISLHLQVRCVLLTRATNAGCPPLCDPCSALPHKALSTCTTLMR